MSGTWLPREVSPDCAGAAAYTCVSLLRLSRYRMYACLCSDVVHAHLALIILNSPRCFWFCKTAHFDCMTVPFCQLLLQFLKDTMLLMLLLYMLAKGSCKPAIAFCYSLPYCYSLQISRQVCTPGIMAVWCATTCTSRKS